MESNNEVVVTNIKMPFISMVIFMVKWAIASVPAFVIFVMIGAIVFQIICSMTGVLGGMERHWPWHLYF